MERYIIKVDEKKCTGCGKCTDICISRALQIIDNKAKLTSEKYCDGFGSCIKTCPNKALTLEYREADEYSEALVMENISESDKIEKHLNILEKYKQDSYIDEAILYLEEKSFFNNNYEKLPKYDYTKKETKKKLIKDSLKVNYELAAKWPTRLDLLFSDSKVLEGADLVISADCAPFAYRNFKEKFLSNNQVLITLCPKSENTIGTYVGKLAYIFEQKNINSITIVKMESECCDEIETLVTKALQFVQLTMVIKTYTITLEGEAA